MPMAGIMVYPQARVLGGGSSINAQVFTRGCPEDYDAWAKKRAAPAGRFRDVLPYFKRSEGNDTLAGDQHGVDGPLGVDLGSAASADARLRAGGAAGRHAPSPPTSMAASRKGRGFTRRRPGTAGAAARRSAISGRRSRARTCRSGPTCWSRGSSWKAAAPSASRSSRTAVVEHPSRRARGDRDGRRDRLAKTLDAVGHRPGRAPQGQGRARRRMTYPASARTCRTIWMSMCWPNCQAATASTATRNCAGRSLAGLEYALFGKGPVASNIVEGGAFWWGDRAGRRPTSSFISCPAPGEEGGRFRAAMAARSTLIICVRVRAAPLRCARPTRTIIRSSTSTPLPIPTISTAPSTASDLPGRSCRSRPSLASSGASICRARAS